MMCHPLLSRKRVSPEVGWGGGHAKAFQSAGARGARSQAEHYLQFGEAGVWRGKASELAGCVGGNNRTTSSGRKLSRNVMVLRCTLLMAMRRASSQATAPSAYGREGWGGGGV